MKPPKFHVGQAVVCINDKWPGLSKDIKPRARPDSFPRRGPIYHVESMSKWEDGWYLRLKELGPECSWKEKAFAPADELSAEALAELLEEVFTPVHA